MKDLEKKLFQFEDWDGEEYLNATGGAARMSIRMGPRDNLGEYSNQLGGGSIYVSSRPSIAGDRRTSMAGSRRESVGSSYSYRNSIVGGMRRDSVQF